MLYRIGSLTIDSAITLPKAFDPFLVEGVPCQPDITLVPSDHPIDTAALGKALKVRTYSIFRVSTSQWLYMTDRRRSQLLVSADYTRLVYCDRDNANPFALDELVRLAIRCWFIQKGVLSIHGACVSYEGQAILFTGISGTGKSTRAAQWVQHLGAQLLSGDRPNLEVKAQKHPVHQDKCSTLDARDPAPLILSGVPWDGKEQIFRNASFLVRAVLDVRRASKTVLIAMTPDQVVRSLAVQNFVPLWDPLLAAQSMMLLKQAAQRMQVYRLYCGPGAEAACETRDALFGDTFSEDHRSHDDNLFAARIYPSVHEILAGDPVLRLADSPELNEDCQLDSALLEMIQNLRSKAGTDMENVTVRASELMEQIARVYAAKQSTGMANSMETSAACEDALERLLAFGLVELDT